MQIEVSDLKKNFGYTSILKPFSFTFNTGGKYAISGRNGSGKSTLLKILSGYLSPSGGRLVYSHDSSTIKRDDAYKYIAYSAPYIEVTQEFTLKETLKHYKNFRSLREDYSYKEFLKILDIKNPKSKRLSNFSSGMKQKVSLCLSLLDTSPILILDEPTSYLDEEAKEWFSTLLNSTMDERTIITASNDTFDFKYMQDKLHIENGSVLI